MSESGMCGWCAQAGAELYGSTLWGLAVTKGWPWYHPPCVDEMIEDAWTYTGPSAVAAEVRTKLIALAQTRVANAHEQADALLCALVRAWGYEEIVAVYESIEKWYD